VYKLLIYNLSYNMTSTNKGENMYIEVTDAIAITIALTTSITLIITTAVRNAKLTRYLQELTTPSK
jgi:F0F1-type ATP synthase membrane subunit a